MMPVKLDQGRFQLQIVTNAQERGMPEKEKRLEKIRIIPLWVDISKEHFQNMKSRT